MSTLKLSTLSNLAGSQSTAVENAINGSAKAWVNFNGTGTVAIRASYNVSSITDNGTGDYTVNFTTAMPDANYSVNGVASDNNSGYPGQSVFSTTLGTRTFGTSSVRVLSCYTYSPSVRDADVVCVGIFR